LSGKLLVSGGLAGVVVSFFPLVSMSVEFLGQHISKSIMVVQVWQGFLGLLAYVAAIAVTVLLYAPSQNPRKELCWAAVGVSAVALLLSLWLLVLAFQYGQGMQAMGVVGGGSHAGAGAFLNLVAAAMLAAGSGLKAREEKLV
jgi:hypothetical protein